MPITFPQGSKVLIIHDIYLGTVGTVTSTEETFAHPQSPYKGCIEVSVPSYANFREDLIIFLPEQLLPLPEGATTDQIEALRHMVSK